MENILIDRQRLIYDLMNLSNCRHTPASFFNCRDTSKWWEGRVDVIDLIGIVEILCICSNLIRFCDWQTSKFPRAFRLCTGTWYIYIMSSDVVDNQTCLYEEIYTVSPIFCGSKSIWNSCRENRKRFSHSWVSFDPNTVQQFHHFSANYSNWCHNKVFIARTNGMYRYSCQDVTRTKGNVNGFYTMTWYIIKVDIFHGKLQLRQFHVHILVPTTQRDQLVTEGPTFLRVKYMERIDGLISNFAQHIFVYLRQSSKSAYYIGPLFLVLYPQKFIFH